MDRYKISRLTQCQIINNLECHLIDLKQLLVPNGIVTNHGGTALSQLRHLIG